MTLREPLSPTVAPTAHLPQPRRQRKAFGGERVRIWAIEELRVFRVQGLVSQQAYFFRVLGPRISSIGVWISEIRGCSGCSV